TYQADYPSAGTHKIDVIVTDPYGLTAEASWTFQVTNVNRKPTATITTIPTAMDDTDKIVLSVDAVDPDGGDLTITWYLSSKNDKILGSGTSIETKLPAGTQTIEVEVVDEGGEKAVDSFSIKVTAVEEESDFGMMLAIVVVVVIVIVVALALMKMRSGPSTIPPEAKMDIDSLEKEYDPSAGRTPDYGDEYNPTPEYDQEGYDRLQ
ncbi:MAG: hypothetical protein GWN18_12025, partial [Thermoplasmata archaeon]|nr:hypothetical protein [Thermoplasmata archaeon]NIS12789.1 hypothetical protein [Thermoplasmata archaeon]NIS20692.1 hypothetical protein [Thermoplasmata archaeon]NIT78093.1 hypothetical protein [Thermoplasmata archaeon]NIU49762.1 hypothetical protein [Thermoplasmata archaeon]